MKIFKLDTSLKNIPVSSQIEFKERLVEQVGKLMRRMRLKVYFSGGKNKKDEMNDTGKETYGFKSRFTPAATNQQLKAFENDLMELVKSVEFRRIKNNFQAELQNDVSRIKGSRNVIVAADKTTNFYEMSKDEYLKLLADNITAGYQKADEKVEYNSQIWNPHLKKHIDKLERIQQNYTKKVFERCNVPFTSYDDRLHKISEISLLNRRKFLDLVFLYKLINNFYDVHFEKFFSLKKRTYALRSHPLQISPKQSFKSSEWMNSFFERTPKVWNNLPANVVTSDSLSNFKLLLKQYFLSK